LGVCSISEYCLKIKVLLLQECKRLSSEGFEHISKNFKCLEELDISSNGEIMTDKAIQTLVRRCPTLTHLNVSESFSITDIAVFAIADHCKMLSCLNLRGCTNVTQNGIVYVIRKCNYLRDLNISRINNISDTSVFAIANHCKALVSLNIQDCSKVTQEGIKYLLVSCPKMKLLFLRRGQIDKLFQWNRINKTNTWLYLCAMHPDLKINKIDDCYSIEK
jgi:F-box/leucine-rich repeat protein 2/20